jgi:hypothetical protein
MSVKAFTLPLLVLIAAASPVARAQTSPPPKADTDDADAPPAPPPAAGARPAPPPSPPPLSVETTEPPEPQQSWFYPGRPPFFVTAGQGKAQWKVQLYGIAVANVANDSTRSFNPGLNDNLVARDGTQAGNLGRTQFTAYNSRIGVEGHAPEIGGIRAWGRVEGDFSGYDPSPTGAATPAGAAAPPSEGSFIKNPTFRIRQAFVALENDYVDILAGQAYDILGWGNYFFPCAVASLGIPMQLFDRTPQVRFGHSFHTNAVNLDFQVGAFRPAQRDSEIPDGEGGVRLQINNWKGIATPGSGGTAAVPAAIAVSGLVRRFKVDEFAANPVGSSTDTGWAVAADVLIPIVPVRDSFDRANALTLIAEASVGSGYAEQFNGFNGSGGFPALPGGAAFVPDIDQGLVTYDPAGYLHTIDWRSLFVGLQYYVPPGRTILSINYTQGESDNMATLFPGSKKAIDKTHYADANIFFDVTPEARIGVSYQYVVQQYVDGNSPRNQRYEAIALYFF